MIVLVDTPVWSLALRRRVADLSGTEREIVRSLQELVREGRAHLLGVVRQEILSGIRDDAQFSRIRDHLRGFTDVALVEEDFEEAAAFNNKCRRSGVAGSAVDMLICSVSLHHGWPIFSIDRDFIHYRKIVPIELFNL